MNVQQKQNGPTDLVPAQVPLFKSTQYFANVLELASVIVALFYEQLPSQNFKLKSGLYIKQLTGLSELSITTAWDKQYVIANPGVKLSLFWQTLYDYIFASTQDQLVTAGALSKIHEYLDKVVQEAKGDTTYQVIYQLQLQLAEDYLSDDPDDPHDSNLRQFLTFDQFIQVMNFLHGFSGTLSDILNFQIPKLSFSYPVGFGWDIDIDAIVDIQLPSTPEKFLTWAVQDRGASLNLHFDNITLDDSTGIAVVHPATKKHGEQRHPFGGSIGDLVFSGVRIELVINGQLADEDKEPVAPYHSMRQAYFTERNHQNIVDIRLRADDVKLGLNHTVLSALFSVINWGIDTFTNFDDLKQKLEDFIHDGLESLHDFGDIGNQIDKALFTPILPGATALKTQDFYKPFVKKHSAFSYAHLHIEGSGRGIHILNEGGSLPDFPDNDGGPHLPPTDGVPDPPILDHADPNPASRVTVSSPFDFLIPTAERRAAMKTQLDATSNLKPDQEAAARLWLDGFSPKSMCWLQNGDIDNKAGTVYGKPASAKTIDSLDRLTKGNTAQPNAFVFSSAAVRPAPGSMLSLAASSFKDNNGIDLHPTPAPIPPPILYASESTLAASKGSVIDPFWAGISINAIAMHKICDILNASDFLVQSGTVDNAGSNLPYHIEPLAVPSMAIDLTGEKDHRPIAKITGLVIRLGDPWTATYLLEISCPMQVMKPDPGCLPDDSLSIIAFNRGCIENLTEGKFTDQSYLDLLYRYFYCLQFVSNEVKITTSTLTHGNPIQQSPAKDKPGHKSGAAAGNPPASTDSNLLTEAMQSTLSQVFPIPAVFDPYYAQTTSLQSFEAKGGWLNIYETYQGLPKSS
ncbi:MAG TPA: hypothetical protein VKX41_07000 [Alloacidobacterium sp.]|jgi:hypothetical protein|nr:hypothetical protein [Alloacidobacterium sp.]